MSKNYTHIFLSLLLSTCLISCSTFTKVQKSNDYEYKLRMAENYFVKENYTNAQVLFEALLPVFKGTAKFENIYYKYAYCAYRLEDYVNAENLFKTFLETFPSSSKSEQIEYIRAYSYYKQSSKVDLDQTNTTKSIALMQAFINTHPNAKQVVDATQIIDVCRAKLELKAFKAAELYFNLGHYKASAVCLTNLIYDFPDSPKADEYKLLSIKAYYRYAENSVIGKQADRYMQVVTECNDFADRFTNSKFAAEVNQLQNKAQNNLKNIEHDQSQKTTGS